MLIAPVPSGTTHRFAVGGGRDAESAVQGSSFFAFDQHSTHRGGPSESQHHRFVGPGLVRAAILCRDVPAYFDLSVVCPSVPFRQHVLSTVLSAAALISFVASLKEHDGSHGGQLAWPNDANLLIPHRPAPSSGNASLGRMSFFFARPVVANTLNSVRSCDVTHPGVNASMVLWYIRTDAASNQRAPDRSLPL